MERNRPRTAASYSPRAAPPTGWRLSGGMKHLAALTLRRASTDKPARYARHRGPSRGASLRRNSSRNDVEPNAVKKSVTYADPHKQEEEKEEVGTRQEAASCVSRLSRQPTHWETYLEEKSKSTDPATRYIPLRGKLVFTYGLLFVCIFLMLQSCIVENGIAPWAVNRLLGPNPSTLLRVGAPRGDFMRQTGQWWRLLWGPFLHAGWLHILMNFVVWYQLGVMIEPDWGFWRTLIVFMLSAVTGSLMSATLSPAYISVGASGGIFGIMGACIPYVFEYWRTIPFPKCILYIMIVSLVLSFVTGFVPYVDNYAHLGGAIGGILSGFMTITKFELGESKSKDDAGDVNKAAPNSGELRSSRLILADSDLRRGSTRMGRGKSYQKDALNRECSVQRASNARSGAGSSMVDTSDSVVRPTRRYEGGGLVRSGQLIPRPRSGVSRQRTAPLGGGCSEVAGELGGSNKIPEPNVGRAQLTNPEAYCFSAPPPSTKKLHPMRATGDVVPNSSRSENLVAYCAQDRKPGGLSSFSNVPVVARPASESLLLRMDEEVGMAHMGNGVRSEMEPQLGRCYESQTRSFSSSASLAGSDAENWSSDLGKKIVRPPHSGSLCRDPCHSSCSQENLQDQELHCVVPISEFVRKSGSLRRRTCSVLRLALRLPTPSASRALVSSHGDAVVGWHWDGSPMEWNRPGVGREKMYEEHNVKKQEHSEVVVFERKGPSSSGSLCLESSCGAFDRDTGLQEAPGPTPRMKVTTVMHTRDCPTELDGSQTADRKAEENSEDYDAGYSQSNDYAQESISTGTFEATEEQWKASSSVHAEMCNEQEKAFPVRSHNSESFRSSNAPDSLIVISERERSEGSLLGELPFQAASVTPRPEVRTPRDTMSVEPVVVPHSAVQEMLPEASGRQSRRSSRAGDTILYRLVTSERLLLSNLDECIAEGNGAPGEGSFAQQVPNGPVRRSHSNTAFRCSPIATPRIGSKPVFERLGSAPKSTASTRDEEPAVLLHSVMSRQYSKGVPSRPKNSVVQKKNSVRRWKRLVQQIQKRFLAVDENGCPKLPARMTVRHTSNAHIDDSFVWKSWKVWCIRLGSGTVLAVIWAVLIVLLGCPSCYTPPGRLSFV